MNADDAIALVKEKDKRRIRCDCPDCQAQTALVAEVERLRGENAIYKKYSAEHDQAEHDAFMRGREVALEYLPDERNQLLAEVKKLRESQGRWMREFNEQVALTERATQAADALLAEREIGSVERDGIRLLLDLVPEMLRKSPSIQAAIAYLTKRVY